MKVSSNVTRNLLKKRDQWEKIVSDFIASGLKQVDYCKKHKLKPHCLSYHFCKYQKQNKQHIQPETKYTKTKNFIPVNIIKNEYCLLKIDNRFELKFTTEMLQEVLSILKSN